MNSSVYHCAKFLYYKCDAQLEGEIYEKWTFKIVQPIFVENVYDKTLTPRARSNLSSDWISPDTGRGNSHLHFAFRTQTAHCDANLKYLAALLSVIKLRSWAFSGDCAPYTKHLLLPICLKISRDLHFCKFSTAWDFTLTVNQTG